ncbi:MAG: thioredoxin family protein [Sulfurovum sp.]|uniref:thioredoxin family protein n=1 Tax=Sulfurovum sp. TaxID=1969726 RepID=UPI002867C741|nr:thioredoxin family protein [Sulfurovum sp.]MCO4845226.1 thioredoxin family protein [Sulfurovum sp.]
MNKIVLGLLLLSSTLFSVEWVKDIDTAFALAKKEHKNIIVLVEGENCRWCKKLKHRTLSDEAVEKRLEKFVTVKVMREDSSAMSVLPKVKGVPSIFFMKENKAVVVEILGYVNVEDFISYINDVEKK